MLGGFLDYTFSVHWMGKYSFKRHLRRKKIKIWNVKTNYTMSPLSGHSLTGQISVCPDNKSSLTGIQSSLILSG